MFVDKEQLRGEALMAGWVGKWPAMQVRWGSISMELPHSSGVSYKTTIYQSLSVCRDGPVAPANILEAVGKRLTDSYNVLRNADDTVLAKMLQLSPDVVAVRLAETFK